MPSEFELIARYFVQRNEGEATGVDLGAGDDCALLTPTPGQRLAVSVDTSVVDVHFPAEAPAHAVGHRALAVALSDLAAMGARARWCTLALTLPDADEAWLDAFSRGFHALCHECGVALVGGDVTRGTLSISVTVHGEVPPGEALRRDGGRVDDLLAVTGPLGSAHGGLQAWQRGERAIATPLLAAYLLPRPRLTAGLALRGLAHCAIDISDGLLADLGHLCEASGLGAVLEPERLPLAPELERWLGVDGARHAALCGGDDYELLFSLPEAALDEARRRLADCGATLYPVGRFRAAPGIVGAGRVTASGWQHFSGDAS
ncbi:MAG: thiamine-phosphate kinase [Halomonas sp.]|nr:thiamine-phosphate kinase [Halomonas sp.]